MMYALLFGMAVGSLLTLATCSIYNVYKEENRKYNKIYIHDDLTILGKE